MFIQNTYKFYERFFFHSMIHRLYTHPMRLLRICRNVATKVRHVRFSNTRLWRLEFQDTDKDKNGTVCFTEIIEHYTSPHNPVALNDSVRTNLEVRFEEMDSDKDGCLTFEEFHEYMLKYRDLM